MPRRRQIWSRLGDDLKPASLERLGRDVGLDGLPDALDAILAGQMLGRTVVSLG